MTRVASACFTCAVAIAVVGCTPSADQVKQAMGATETVEASIQEGIKKTQQAAEPSPTSIPTATSIPKPTSTPRPLATPTPDGMRTYEGVTCYRWDTITLDDVGKTLCVWGDAVKQRVDQDNGVTWLYFGSSPQDFQFVNYAQEGYYQTWDMESFSCMYLEGPVHKIGQTPVITIKGGNVYTCD